MGHDLKRVGTLVLLPPVLVASYIAACGIFGFVGAQVWLEYFAMRPGPVLQKHTKEDEPNASGIMEWGWGGQEDWSGGVKGGTDPSLGMFARIAIRSAWLFNTWAGQMGQQNVYSQSSSSSSSSSSASYIKNALLGSTDRAHALAEQSLAWALEYIDSKYPDRPISNALLLRHADLLEHLATPNALSEARREVSTVYREMTRGSYDRCRLALRLGGLCITEGGKGEAVRFWREALQVRPGGENGAYTPEEERLIADAYLQLSALYSTDSRLDQAMEIQRQGLQAIDTFTHAAKTNPTEGDQTDPGDALHTLYLTHRAAVLSIHAAEVHYAQTRDARSTLSRLDSAAEQSGVVVRSLSKDEMAHISPAVTASISKETETTAKSNTTASAAIMQPPTFQISTLYSDSRVLTVPATALLRDARRAAMQALVLEGMLLETMEDGASNSSDRRPHKSSALASPRPDHLTRALAAYEQALVWAGTTLKAAQALGIPEEEVVHVRRRFELLRRRIGREQMISEGRD